MVSFNADLFARDVRVGRAMLALDLREMAKETGVSFRRFTVSKGG